MTATYNSLKRSYAEYNQLDMADLYTSLGWTDVIDKPGWANTCAVRMHLALLDAGESIPGRFTVHDGKHKGKQIEPSRKLLAEKIDRSGKFGPTHKFSNEELYGGGYKSIGGKAGIVSFDDMSYPGGHIDVLDTRTWSCLRTCYLNAGEIWFWALA